MNIEEVKTIVELLKQAYMDEKWELVLESIEMLQREEEVGDYEQEKFDDLDF